MCINRKDVGTESRDECRDTWSLVFVVSGLLMSSHLNLFSLWSVWARQADLAAACMKESVKWCLTRLNQVAHQIFTTPPKHPPHPTLPKKNKKSGLGCDLESLTPDQGAPSANEHSSLNIPNCKFEQGQKVPSQKMNFYSASDFQLQRLINR